MSIKITTNEIKQQIAEAYSKRESKYPRCNCNDNKHLAAKWKKDAEQDTCGFIKSQFGVDIRNLDTSDRRTLRDKCLTFLPKKKAKLLLEQPRGKRPVEFYTQFCEKPHEATTQLNDKNSLAFLARAHKKFEDVKTIKDIASVATQSCKLVRENSLLFGRLSKNIKAAILENISKYVKKLRSKSRPKFTKRTQFDTKMSLSDAEALVLAKNKDLVFNPETDRIEGSHKKWILISHRYGTKLPQRFLDKYASELTYRMKSGRPKKQNVLNIAGDTDKPATQRKKKTKSKPQTKKSPKTTHQEQQDTKSEVTEDAINSPATIVPVKMLADPEALRTFINTTMKKHDVTYPLSTEISRWSNPEWSMVDAYRDSIAPALLKTYEDKIKQARSILGIKSGGAYASIRDNRMLAVAHIVTSWVCGDLV